MANEETIRGALLELKNVATAVTTSELHDLSALATKNLKELIKDPDGVFATDPELALKAVETLTKAENAQIEAQRRVVDTMVKAKSLLDPQPDAPSNTISDRNTPPEIEGSGATSIFG